MNPTSGIQVKSGSFFGRINIAPCMTIVWTLSFRVGRTLKPAIVECKIPTMKPTMKTKSRFLILALSASLPLTVPAAHADTFGSGVNTFTIGFVPIGNAGNANDTVSGAGPNYGAVPYNYNMSTYAISQDQLAKASNSLGISLGGGAWVGSQPAANVKWYQAAAFVNYLNTSTGHAKAYNLDTGATALTLWTPSDAGYDASNLYRNSNAYYFLPSDNEYYKAAFYDPNKAGGAGYWLYATGSDAIPTAVGSGTTAGTAVYMQTFGHGPAAVNSAGGLSPYGTMGQTGNVSEWLESASDGVNNTSTENRRIRGSDWSDPSEITLVSYGRSNTAPTASVVNVGFRVASVPEPSCVVLMLGSGLMFLARRRRGSSL